MIENELIGEAEWGDFQEIASFKIPEFDEGCTVAKLNQLSLEDLKHKYTPVFLRLIRDEHIESGYTNALDEFITEIVEKDPIIASNWFNYIYLKYNNDNRALLALMHSFSRIDIASLRPALAIMALASMSHKDVEIREVAIRCFENWGDSTSLEMLKATAPDSEEWINEYKNAVILDIEKTLN